MSSPTFLKCALWAAKDNGDLINWPNALSYCQNYSGGGYTDWRMPTLAELSSLYNPEVKNRNGYHITKLVSVRENKYLL